MFFLSGTFLSRGMEVGRAEAAWQLLMQPNNATTALVHAAIMTGNYAHDGPDGGEAGPAVTSAQRRQQAVEAAFMDLPAPAMA